MNSSVAKAAGFQSEERPSPPAKTPGQCFFHSSVKDKSSTKSKASGKKQVKILVADRDPIVQLGMTNEEVQHRTGCKSEKYMLFQIFAICEGDIDLICKRYTSLTWYEEWFFFFEFMYGRTFTKWWSASKTYGPTVKHLMRVFRFKLALVRRARERWPKFVSFEEDIELRKPKWNAKYSERPGVEKMLVVMWDMTGIDAYKFSSAEDQRDTYSKYYAGNKFKGGIGTQLCGYGVTWELWTGHCSDSTYHEESGYLQEQEEFQKRYLVDGEIVRFCNVHDKGYRVRAANERHGNQLTAQPVFGKSDLRFKGRDTLFSASIASDRGGNERTVNVSKRSGYVKRGYQPGMDPVMFNDVWLCWMFMANFMYSPVL